VASRLKPGDIFIDIGANIGYYSLLASRRVGHDGRVFAYEASPSVFDQLRKNLNLNRASNVTARNVAITAQRCKVPIYVNKERMGESTILAGVAEKIDARLEANVAGHPLGDLLSSDIICAARFIKIDVEGAEWLVVKGIQELIPTFSDRTEIIIEINTSSVSALGSSINHLLGLFTKAGFSAFEINNSYELGSYIRRDRPHLTAYDDKPFVRKDFVLKRDHT
ncbi:MAG: FkbM family methyltransferase, partial [Rhabdochlamydiaceae bacterium]